MALFGIRFDLRNPAFADVSSADRYQAAIDMSEWADRHGFATVVLSEHHGSADGYLPSPVTLAAAIAARTTNIRINIAALVPRSNPGPYVGGDTSVVHVAADVETGWKELGPYATHEMNSYGQCHQS